MIRLSVVVPATNSPPSLPACLDAIAASEVPPDETVVVREPPFGGPGAARNAGAARASGDVIAFVDADVVVQPDALGRIRARFDADPSLGALFGAYDDRIATVRLAAAFRNLLHHHVHTRAAGVADTFWAGLGAVRADVLADAGGFDEARFSRSSIEDVELGLRLSDRGVRIVLDPGIRGTHLKDWTLRQMLHTDLFRRGVPWVELIVDRRRVPSSLNLGWRERVSALLAVGAMAAGGRLRLSLGGALAALLVLANLPLYRVLRRRLGTARTVACVPLHVAHHCAAALAVPLGLVRAATGRRRRRRP